jgi:hypothetical protein
MNIVNIAAWLYVGSVAFAVLCAIVAVVVLGAWWIWESRK